jgi:trk system potassium uptake protein TrkH
VLFRQALTEMKYLSHPRGVFRTRVGQEALRKDVVFSIAGFFFLYLLFLLITTLVTASGGNDLLTSLSAALATLGNIGPGFGRVGPTGNYAFLADPIKWFLSFAMVAGRLEIYTVLVLLTPRFWRA